MNPNKRNYKATFILDNRGKEDSVDTIIEGVKKEIAAVHGEVTAAQVGPSGREQVQRDHRQPHAHGVLPGVPLLVPQQGGPLVEELRRVPAHHHVADGERRGDRNPPPVAGAAPEPSAGVKATR